MATRQTHSGIFNLQGQPSHFLKQNIGEGNRTKSNAVYHSGSNLEIKKIIKHFNFECHPSKHLNSKHHSLLQTFVSSISSLQTLELRRHPSFRSIHIQKIPKSDIEIPIVILPNIWNLNHIAPTIWILNVLLLKILILHKILIPNIFSLPNVCFLYFVTSNSRIEETSFQSIHIQKIPKSDI